MLRKYRMWIWVFIAGLTLGILLSGYVVSQQIFIDCAHHGRVQLMGGGVIECHPSTKE